MSKSLKSLLIKNIEKSMWLISKEGGIAIHKLLVFS